MRGLTLGVEKRELLTDAILFLKSGVRYGLIGRNGTGKVGLKAANKSANRFVGLSCELDCEANVDVGRAHGGQHSALMHAVRTGPWAILSTGRRWLYRIPNKRYRIGSTAIRGVFPKLPCSLPYCHHRQSTLLRALANKVIPGLPRDMKVRLVRLAV